MKAMELITGKENLKDFARESWFNMSTQILEQARLEAGHNNRIAVALKEVEGIYDGKHCNNINHVYSKKYFIIGEVVYTTR